MKSIFVKLDNFIYFFEKWLIVLITILMTLVIFFDFLGRYIFSQSITWAGSAGSYLMFWLGLIGASMATKNEKHLRANIINKILPSQISKYLISFSYFLAMIFCIIFTYLSFIYTLDSFKFGDISNVLNIPLWIVQIILPISFLIMTYRFGFYSLKYLVKPTLEKGCIKPITDYKDYH